MFLVVQSFRICLIDFRICHIYQMGETSKCCNACPAVAPATKDANPMTQADSVHSTPPTNTPNYQSAPGAFQLFSPLVILTSPPDACQGVKTEPETSRVCPFIRAG